MLKRIASRVDGHKGVIAIEASSPVPYVASQPDPRTFVVELRDVVAVGFQNDFAADPRHPIAGIQVESAAADRWVIVTRVRMTLDEPMRPRVRSTRNVIYVEAERAESAPAAKTAATEAADQPHRPVTSHSGPQGPEAWRGDGSDAARDVAADCHERDRAEGRTAPRRHQPSERDVGASDNDQRRAGPGSSGFVSGSIRRRR